MRRVVPLLLVSALVLGCAESRAPTDPSMTMAASTAASTAAAAARVAPRAAVMTFGNPEAGSPFPPPSGHDASLHAKDKINPRTVVITAGSAVTFNVMPTHRVAVYDAGTEPTDIEVSPATLVPLGGIPQFGIDDPDGRLALQPESDFSFVAPSTFAYTFTTPGRYLVICVFTPHFTEAKMYAWVIVQ